MKRAFNLLIIMLYSSRLLSQDLIVTTKGDSLNCRITKEKGDKIYFTYRHEYDIIDTSMPLSEIKNKQTNFYQRSEIPISWNSRIGEFKPVQITVDEGFGLMMARLSEDVPEELKDFYHALRSGHTIGAGISCYLDETIGFGFRYSSFFSSNSLNNINSTDRFGQSFSGNLREKWKISFYGASLSLRTLFSSTALSSFYTTYFVGYLQYNNDYHCSKSGSYKITGGTVGVGIEGGYDLEIFPDVLLGCQASFTAGALRKLKVDDGKKIRSASLEKGKYESLHRVDFSIGLRLRL